MADVILNTINPRPPALAPSLDGKILNVVNGNLPDADTSYVYIGLVRDGYNLFTLQYVLQATTLTIEVSNDLPEISNGSARWDDITSTLISGGGSSLTTSGTLTISFPLEWSRMRIKRVTTNATNACALILTRGTF